MNPENAEGETPAPAAPQPTESAAPAPETQAPPSAAPVLSDAPPDPLPTPPDTTSSVTLDTLDVPTSSPTPKEPVPPPPVVPVVPSTVLPTTTLASEPAPEKAEKKEKKAWSRDHIAQKIESLKQLRAQRLSEIAEDIRLHGSVTIKEIRTRYHITKQTAYSYMRELVKKGLALRKKVISYISPK